MARAKRPEGAGEALPPLPDPRTDLDAWRAAVTEREGFDPLTEIGFTLTDEQRREMARREEAAARKAVAERAALLQARQTARQRRRQVPPAVTVDELRRAVARIVLFAQHYDRPKMDPDGTEHPDVPSGPAEIAARGDAEMTRRLRAVLRAIDNLTDHVRCHLVRVRLGCLIGMLAREYAAIAEDERRTRQQRRMPRAAQNAMRKEREAAQARWEAVLAVLPGLSFVDDETLARLRDRRSSADGLKWVVRDLLTMFLRRAPMEHEVRTLLATPGDFAPRNSRREKRHHGPKDLAVANLARLLGFDARSLYTFDHASRAHPSEYFHNEWTPEMADSLLGRKRLLEYVCLRLLSLGEEDLQQVLQTVERARPSHRRAVYANPPATVLLTRRR